MTKKEELELWKKLFGDKVESFTEKGKFYTVFLGEHGWTCTCPDYKYRKGSYIFVYTDPETGKRIEVQGCKHIRKVLIEKLGVDIHTY